MPAPISRKAAKQIISSTFEMFHFGLISMYDLGLKNEKAKDEFFHNARQLDESVASSDYEATVNSLDAPGFLEYYRYIGQFAGCYKIANWKDYREYEPIQIEQLNQELVKHEKTEEKLELVDSFHEEELQSEKFLFSSKVRLLYDILDDNFVGDDKEEGINKVLESFNTSDKASFISKIQSDRNLLESLIDKVNGTEKDEMFGIIGELFITSGFISGKKITSLNNSKNDSINAEFEKGRVNIEIESPQKGGMRDYRTTITKRISADPFDIIGMTYDGRQIQLPALLLLKSWTNTFGTPEGIFYNYYKEDLNWNKLSEDEKDEYFTDFVTHYLPSGFIKAFGNPLQIIILSCITVITAGLFAELEGALLAIGLTMTAIDAKNSIEGIVEANRLKESSQTTHEAKKAAKYMADNIAKLSIDALNVICAVAGYLKGKKTIKNKEIQSKIGYKDGWNEKKVLASIEKTKAEGKVILPQEYLTESYINSQINSFKNDGVAYLVPKDVLEIYGRKILGRPDGQFVMKRSELKTVLSQANGNIAKLEKILGIDKGTWTGKTIVMIEITDVEIINLRIPSGFETGINPQWIPGGKLPTGMNEAVCDRIILGNYKETELWK